VAYVGFRGLQLGEGKENLFNGIAKTTDAGQTWKIVFKESNHAAANLSGTWVEQRASQGNDNIWFDTPYSLGVAPTNPGVAYATDLFRTYRTLDGGATWQEMNSKRVRRRQLDLSRPRCNHQLRRAVRPLRFCGTSIWTIPIWACSKARMAANPGEALPRASPKIGATPPTGWPSTPPSAV
jgi:photosystem II stability/assembly factor-like uncharacterized protein